MAQTESAASTSEHVAPDILVSLRQQSLEIGSMAMRGIRGPSPKSDEKSPKALLSSLERMEQVRCEQQNRLNTGRVTAEDFSPDTTEEHLKELIKHREKQVQNMKVLFHNKKLLLQRVLVWGAIHNELLKKTSESKLLYDTMEHSRGLCPAILELQKETHRLEEELTEVKKKRMQLKEKSATLLTQIKNRSEKQKYNMADIHDREIKNIMIFLEKERNLTVLLQNVFQRIIFASRVNWAEDPKLRATVLKLDKDPTQF